MLLLPSLEKGSKSKNTQFTRLIYENLNCNHKHLALLFFALLKMTSAFLISLPDQHF